MNIYTVESTRYVLYMIYTSIFFVFQIGPYVESLISKSIFRMSLFDELEHLVNMFSLVKSFFFQIHTYIKKSIQVC